MSNGPRSIYSRRQRMAPGQYDNPLADFLDSLPGYVNQFQQNQLALGRQQLEERRYQDSIDRQDRRDEEVRDQRKIENLKWVQLQKEKEAVKANEELKYQEGLVREEENEKREIVHSLIRAGKPEQALALAKNLNDTDLITSLQAINQKEEGRSDDFEAIRSKAGRKDTNPFEYRDEIKAFRDKYDIKPGDSIDRQIYSLESLNNKEINRRNKGMIPISEWEDLDSQGRADYQALVTAEKVLADLREEQASPTGAITGKIGDVPIEDRIEREKEKIRILQNKPRYKLETETEYRARKEFNKTPFGFGPFLQEGETQESFYASSAFPNTTPTEENFTQVNDAVSKDLDKVLSDPNTPTNEAGSSEEDYPVATEAVPGLSTEEKRELGMPMLNLPTVEAGQDSPQAPTKTDTTLKLGKEISANVKKPKGRYGSVEGALAETYKKMEKIKKLEDKSSYNLKTKGGQQSYKNSLKQADKLRNQLKEDILSIYDPNTEQFRYPGYADMFSPVGDTVMSFGREKQLDTRNIAGGFTGRQRIPVTDIMPFIQELFPPQFASR